MSISIKGFDKLNKIWKDNSCVAIAFFQKEFAPILVSSYNDSIYLTDKDIIKGRQLLFLLKTINNFLPKGIICKVGSGKRTEYINGKIKGSSPSSQHPFWEALDLHFYKDGKRIREKRVLYTYYRWLGDIMGDQLQQIILYSTFIHIGVATSRREVSKLRKIKGMGF